MLMVKRKHLYWSPLIKETIQKGISLVGYIYSHTFTLNLLETFTNKKELMRPAVTRFATSFLTLERIHEEKDNLRRMFTSIEWVQNTLSKDAKGKEVAEIVIMTLFWENVVCILKVMEPLVRVLRLVVGEKKLAMGYIYESMEKAKETIRGSFEKNEQRYRDIFKIIDDRWNCQLHSPLHEAGHILKTAIYYDNKGLEFDFKVTKGLHDCIDRLVPNKEDRNKILRELSIYKNGEDMFGIEIAQRQRQRNGLAPALWWELFGLSAPTLQQLAIKILGSTCSAFGCEIRLYLRSFIQKRETVSSIRRCMIRFM
ncbi:uncharacterized protein LOC121794979 [Salvia splendens]|uniref:uncharacterized protein LOC121794979 n=1 Tax=Salvia splendens TaxID=180675 RepID=UPI001C26A1E1|nr:uncharacterized protein LOC121794979 [Salvia splendens]XP_042049335.1 uncharacterized protein LOC121794979 [Salvia splendens]